MVDQKRIIEVTRKWQKMAALARKRISLASRVEGKPSSLARKGHFVVQTLDGKKFMVPLTYLKSSIFMELFRRSEEEFGLPSDGSIMIPCDSTSMEYVISLLIPKM